MMRKQDARALAMAVGALAAFIPFLFGYGYLFAAHPAAGDPLPWYVCAAAPLVCLGPKYPSMMEFLSLALGNVTLWASAGFLVTGWLLHSRAAAGT